MTGDEDKKFHNLGDRKIYLNYIPQTVDVILVSGGKIANETRRAVLQTLYLYGPYWKIATNGVMVTKYVGCKLFYAAKQSSLVVIVKSNVMKMNRARGTYSQYFIFFVTNEWYDKLVFVPSENTDQ